MNIEIKSLRRDGGTQPRAGILTEIVDNYAEALVDGAEFPPVVVFYDGAEYWLADGFHRAEAHIMAGIAEIEAEVRQGARRDAVLFSTGANATHGLPRTREDKWRAVSTLLLDDEWSKWSDREIARKTGTAHPFVGAVRTKLTGNVTSDERAYTTKHGAIAIMNTAAIGVPAEEVERIKKEAKAEAADLAERLANVEAASREAAAKASRREANLIERASTAEKEKSAAIANAGLKAQAALADRIANAEAKEKAALELARETTRTLDAAVAKAKADAEQAAIDNAEALAAAALAKTRAEAEKWEAKAAEALRRNEGYAAAGEKLQAKLKEHQAHVARIGDDEYDAMAQIKIADSVIMEMNVSMVAMVDLEDALPQPSAIPKLAVARQMCEQMGQALQSLLNRTAKPSEITPRAGDLEGGFF